MNKSKRSTAPKGLSPLARKWWDKLVEQYGIDDDGGQLVLEQALRAFDRVEQARALLDKEGVVLRDRWQQAKPHPAVTVERDARAGMLAALKALNLDVEPLHDRPGRPGGR